MKLIILTFSLLTVMLDTCHKTKPLSLFNGKDLDGWDTYIGPDLDDTGKPVNGQPVGLNNDPRHVFCVIKEGGENIIRISGES